MTLHYGASAGGNRLCRRSRVASLSVPHSLEECSDDRGARASAVRNGERSCAVGFRPSGALAPLPPSPQPRVSYKPGRGASVAGVPHTVRGRGCGGWSAGGEKGVCPKRGRLTLEKCLQLEARLDSGPWVFRREAS
ncbi:hypothetical protein MTO96_022599 [Rhipicephalus appendiculatus]